jgi:hypothetical protein
LSGGAGKLAAPGAELSARSIRAAFVLVAIISSLSVFIFAGLKPGAGAAVSSELEAPQEVQPAAAE